ncbi:MAG TPA: helix-turn-helix domain-containing protein [Devosia sp.]|nr:helix-turn-helix domain-containing protein [Devosia sp.]
MRVTRDQMAQNRIRILDAASELFRAKGFDAVTVAEVMKAAGLTHGGFYGHFSSKEDLIAKTLDHVFKVDSSAPFDLSNYVERYLSPLHRDNPGRGCPTAGMVAETRHQSEAARQAMGDGTSAQIARIASGIKGEPADRRRLAIVSWAAMVGTVMIARGIEDQELSNELLSETRTWIEEAIGKEKN